MPFRRKNRYSRALTRPLLILGGAALTGLAAGLLSLIAPERKPVTTAPTAQQQDTISRHFTLCKYGGGQNCVVDGDTIRLSGDRIRIADIDTPETNPPRCAQEKELGERATKRMQELLNKGPFSVEEYGDRPEDRYGRQLRIITRGGQSLGDILVGEGLARPYDGGRRSWC